MGFMLTSHLRATYDAGAKCVTTDVTVLRNCKLVNVLADPVLTTVSAESQDKKRPASRVLLNAFRHKIVMSFVPHTDFSAWSPNSGLHVAYRKACSWTRCSHSSFV